MKVFVFKYYVTQTELVTEKILANNKEEAESMLNAMFKLSIFKNQYLDIEHSFIEGTPTNYKVKKRDDKGFPTLIEWRDKFSKSMGVIEFWVELPPRINKS